LLNLDHALMVVMTNTLELITWEKEFRFTDMNNYELFHKLSLGKDVI
jgi:hypothetical protein